MTFPALSTVEAYHILYSRRPLVPSAFSSEVLSSDACFFSFRSHGGRAVDPQGLLGPSMYLYLKETCVLDSNSAFFYMFLLLAAGPSHPPPKTEEITLRGPPVTRLTMPCTLGISWALLLILVLALGSGYQLSYFRLSDLPR